MTLGDTSSKHGPGPPISIHGRNARTIPPDRVFFAFASGRFSYNCGSCNAQCCRGHGYFLNAGAELDHQLRQSPNLKFFLRPVPSGGTRFYAANCPPACFFLNEGGLCNIHVRHGYSAKPETCRLFPFNNIRLVGDCLVIAPHDTLCPLQIVPPSQTSDQSTHSGILKELRATGIAEPVSDGQPYSAGVFRGLVLEREIVQLSEQHLGEADYWRFAAAQVCATRRYVGQPSDDESADLELREHLRHVCSVLGADTEIAACSDSATVRALVAATPVIRSQLIFPPRDAPKDLRVPPERIPYFLASLWVLLMLARHSGMKQVTFQTVSRLWHNEWALLAFLSHIGTAVAWRPDIRVHPPRDANAKQMSMFVHIAKALAPKVQLRHQVVLADVVSRIVDLEGIERVEWLRTLSRSLVPAIIPIAELSRCRGRGTFRTVCERWAWTHVDAETLTWAIQRQFNRARH